MTGPRGKHYSKSHARQLRRNKRLEAERRILEARERDLAYQRFYNENLNNNHNIQEDDDVVQDINYDRQIVEYVEAFYSDDQDDIIKNSKDIMYKGIEKKNKRHVHRKEITSQDLKNSFLSEATFNSLPQLLKISKELEHFPAKLSEYALYLLFTFCKR